MSSLYANRKNDFTDARSSSLLTPVAEVWPITTFVLALMQL